MTGQKVVHVTSVHIWSDTRIFQRMCQGLANRRWDVTLVAPSVEDQRVNGVRVVGVEVPKSRVLRAIFGGYRAVAAARRLPAAVYHLHDPELLLWKWMLRHRPVVYDMHEYVPGAITTRPWIPALIRKPLAALWRTFERLTLRNSPVVFAENSYKEHYRWLPTTAVVLNLPDTETLLGIDDQSEPDRVIYVGRVSRARGSIRMLEAVTLLKRRALRVKLDIVGPISDEHKRELEEIIGRDALEDVTLHGYMTPVEAWKLAKRAAVGLAVLEPEPNYIGSFPTKMFEYMALGLPVVVSNFPLYRQVVEGSDCGLCIDPLSSPALADAIEHLISDQSHARQLGRNGRGAVSTLYRWDRQLDGLETFYAAIMRSPNESAA